MPVVFPPSGFGRNYQQTAKGGVTLTAGATVNTMGAWATLIDPLSYPVFGVWLNAWGVSGSATNTSMLADIGVGPTGGGSEQIVIPYLDFGAAYGAAGLQVGKFWFFPLYVPAGKAIRGRCQSVIASDTAVVLLHAFELPPHGFAEDAPQEWKQYGAVAASSAGTAVTSGSAAYGTAVDVTGGSGTTRAHRWFHVGLDFGTNTAISAGKYRVRLSRDSGGADIIGIWDFGASTAEELQGPCPAFPVCYPAPSGSLLYVAVDGAAAEALGAIVYAY